MHTRLLVVTAIAIVTAAAHAADTKNDGEGVLAAAIPLTQAVGIAEQHVGGKASRASHKGTSNGPLYEVEVIAGTKVYDVRVDATHGTVVSSVEDGADREDEDDDD